MEIFRKFSGDMVETKVPQYGCVCLNVCIYLSVVVGGGGGASCVMCVYNLFYMSSLCFSSFLLCIS